MKPRIPFLSDWLERRAQVEAERAALTAKSLAEVRQRIEASIRAAERNRIAERVLQYAAEAYYADPAGSWSNMPEGDSPAVFMARDAYLLADAMLAERDKP